MEPEIFIKIYRHHDTFIPDFAINPGRFTSGFKITTEIVHDSHDFHDKICVVQDFLAGPTIFGAFFEVKYTGYHEMPQKACERGFFHVIAISKN